MTSRLIGGLLVVVALAMTTTVHAADSSRPFLVDRGSVEVLFAVGGWRSGVSTSENNPGFSVLGGGGEMLLGIEVRPGIGIIVDGRTLAGPRLDGVYVEGLAGLGLQLRVSDWVRVRVGAAAGQARLDRNSQPTDYAALVGGFLAASVDLFRLLHERASAVIVLRFDADGHLDAGSTYSKESIALSVGVGFRY